MPGHAPPLAVLALFAAAWVTPAAPADSTGRNRQDFYAGYSGWRWEHDYQVLSGHCDRAAIGAVFGAGTGPLLGPSGERQNRAAATLIGAAVGDLVGRKVGLAIDEGDRACIGHTLELGRPGRRVAWDNAATGVHYELVPDDGHSEIAGLCRGFKLKAKSILGKSKRRGMACEKSPGLWQLTKL